MNIELEKINCKNYQFFPLQTNIIPKFIQIDTTSLIELLVSENKNDYLKDIENSKYFLWDEYFPFYYFIIFIYNIIKCK
jgi:hypothetical protein